MDDEDDGLLNIEISDAEDDGDKKAQRTGQSEDAFQAVKREYRAKVEDGDLYKYIRLPLGPRANKQHVQEILHAVEELYFFRKYQDAVDLVHKVLKNGGAETLDRETRRLLEVYEAKCKQRLHAEASV